MLLGLAVLMLATAWFRKRLYLGIAMALYGLSIFNLHYWGFGVPVHPGRRLVLVRAYRLQQKLKLAKADSTSGPVRRARRRPPVRRRPGQQALHAAAADDRSRPARSPERAPAG